MLLWLILLAGFLIAATLLVVAMLRAERRARRSLYRALDLSEETIELLMTRNGDVLSELTLVRITPPATLDLTAPDSEVSSRETEPQAHRHHQTIRLVHPAEDRPDDPEAGRKPPNSQRHGGG